MVLFGIVARFRHSIQCFFRGDIFCPFNYLMPFLGCFRTGFWAFWRNWPKDTSEVVGKGFVYGSAVLILEFSIEVGAGCRLASRG